MNTKPTSGNCPDHEDRPASTHSVPDGKAARRWLARMPDLDAIYQRATLLIIPLFAVCTAIRSEIFVFYAILFVLKVRRHGYRKTGLEWYTLAAVLGLAVSYAGVWQTAILKHVLQVARIIALPLLMSQYRPPPRPERALACIFAGLAVYGIARMQFWPLVTGYAQDRPYCFSDFFMHSSVIAVAGYLFSLTMLVRGPSRRAKALGAAGAAVYLYLVAIHTVRASYLAVVAATLLLLILEIRRVHWRQWLAVCLVLAGIAGLFGVMRTDATRYAWERARSIASLSDGSNRGRLVIWKRAIEVFRENPVNGIGYRRFNRHFLQLGDSGAEWSFAHAHNELLGLLAETGVIGVLAWLAFKFRLFLLFFRDRRQWISVFMLCLFLAFEVHNLFEYYLYERTAYIFVYLLLGLGLNQALARRMQAVRGEEPA